MKNLSFKAQRAFTKTFGKTKMTFDRAIRISLIANALSVGTGAIISKGYEDPPNQDASIVLAQKTNMEIGTYAQHQRTLVTLQNNKQELAVRKDLTKGERAKQLGKIEKDVASLNERSAVLATQITTTILQNPALAEEAASVLAENARTTLLDKSPAILKPAEGGARFLNECRVTYKDNAAISSCLTAKYEPYVQIKGATSTVIVSGMLGTIFGLSVFGFAAGALRPRVERQEKKIIEDEFKTSVDSLRDLLAPSKNDKPKP